MNNDTSQWISLPLLEKGMRTLTHEWRNVLNGINLRINAARVEDDSALREADLDETLLLVSTASDYLTDLGRKLAPPTITPIAYPVNFFLEDLAIYLEKQAGAGISLSDWIIWDVKPLERKVMIDFNGITRAMAELLGNTRRYLSKDSILTIGGYQVDEWFILTWSEIQPNSIATEAWGKYPFLTTERGHLGLGIYYARRVIEAHSGTLSFEYLATKQLLLTTIRLPLGAL